MSGPTPGPWTVQRGIDPHAPELPAVLQIIRENSDGGARYIADLLPHFYPSVSEELRAETEANALLLAAAAQMFQALEELVREADAPVGWEGHSRPDTCGFEMARKALRNATGEAAR